MTLLSLRLPVPSNLHIAAAVKIYYLTEVTY